MKDRSKIIFGNEISKRVYKKALKSKTKNIKKFGDDTAADYKICLKKNPVIGDSLFVSDVLLNDEKSEEKLLSLEILEWVLDIIEFRWQWHLQPKR